MKKQVTVTWICSSALIGLMVSCTHVKVVSWKNPDVSERAIGKTMILAATDSDSLCRQYESMFSADLAIRGFQAQGLHSLIQSTDKLKEDQLVSLLKENGFKSLIVTRLSGAAQRSAPQIMSEIPVYYTDYWGYYSRTVTIVAQNSDPMLDTYQEYHLETNLYDVETRKLIWAGRNAVSGNRSAKRNMVGIINAAIRDLEKNGLLQK